MAKQKQLNSLGELVSQASEGIQRKDEKKVENKQVAAPISTPMQSKGKAGRKPSNRTIARTNGLTIFFEDSHRDAMSRIGGFDKQDIIRTAMHEFINKYFKNGNITEEGRGAIEKYVASTTISPQSNSNETW